MPHELPPEAKTRLSDMEFDFISLVPAGDDPMAKVVLAKAAPEDKNPTPKTGTTTVSRQTSKERTGMANTKPKGKTTKRTSKSDDNDELVISKDDLDPEVVEYIEALEDAVALLSKDDDADDDDDEEVDEVEDDDEEEEEDDDAEKAAAAAASKSLKKALAKADPALREVIEKQIERAEAAEQRAAEAEKVAKAERDERVRKEFVTKAQAMPMISEKPSELADILKGVHDLDPKLGAKVEKLLVTANENIAKGDLFSEIGKTGGGVTLSESVDAAAKAIQKDDPDLTYEQAVAKAYEQNPRLYDEEMKGA